MVVADMVGGIERAHGEPVVYTEGIYSVELNPGLQEWEVEEAWRIIRWLKGNGPFFGIAGVMLVSGPPRQGKGLFSNTLAWKIKRYFMGKHVLRDDVPTKLFGEYTLFNEDTLMEDVADMAQVSESDIPREAKKTADKALLKKMTDKWSTERGQILLQNAVLLKDEFWKDMNKRRPMAPMNLTMGGLIKMWGHLDMLLIGVIQSYHDLDRFTCLPWVSHHVKCTWCQTIPNTTQASLYHVQWSEAQQKLIPVSKKPIWIYIDGSKPRAELGGAGYFEIFNSKTAPNLKALSRLPADFKQFNSRWQGGTHGNTG